MNVSAVIPTRGDVDMTPILASLPPEWELLVWDNSHGVDIYAPGERAFGVNLPIPDLGVYGRYAAIKHARFDLVFTQDDDVIVSDPRAIVYESDQGGSEFGRLACNMPPEFRHDFYTDHALVGFGACFHRDLPAKAFNRFSEYLVGSSPDPWLDREWVASFHRTCDIVFTALTPHVLVDVERSNREMASDPNRMWKQSGHMSERMEMLNLVRKVREA